MNYSGTAILALLVHIIINYDVLRNAHYRAGSPAASAYRTFIFGVMVFYLSDALWGLLYDTRINALVFADTVLYFFAMAASVFMWIRYVIRYLNMKSRFVSVLSAMGWIFLGLITLMQVLNLFMPLLFRFDEAGEYHAGKLRYLVYTFQIVLFLVTAAYVHIRSGSAESAVRSRYQAIVIYGIVMTVMIVLQVFEPLLPMYSIGCLLGNCILHTFVVGNIKEDRRRELEEMVRKNELQRQALGSARHLAYTDSLTSVKNTHAYVETEKELDERIADGRIREFGVVVFDINGLKQVNDTKGHDAGDRYIKESCRMICRQFTHSPVYRIGGDEFVAILEGEDYQNRKNLIASFENQVEENLKSGLAVVASGLAVFRREQDHSYRRVFERADQRMYDRKGYLKAM